jgi:hypothetical protein
MACLRRASTTMLFKLRRHRVVDPGIAALRADEHRDLPDHYYAKLEIHGKGHSAWLLSAAAYGTTPDVLAHDCFLPVLKSAQSAQGPTGTR